MATAESRKNPEFGEDEALTLAGAAKLLYASKEDVAALIETAGLPARKVGTEWRISKRALYSWLSIPPRYYHHMSLEVVALQEELSRVKSQVHDLGKQLREATSQAAAVAGQLSRKERLMRFAGKWRDDPDMAEVFSEIERARKDSIESES